MFVPPHNWRRNIFPNRTFLEIIVASYCPKLQFFWKVWVSEAFQYLFKPKIGLYIGQIGFEIIFIFLKVDVAPDNRPKLEIIVVPICLSGAEEHILRALYHIICEPTLRIWPKLFDLS